MDSNLIIGVVIVLILFFIILYFANKSVSESSNKTQDKVRDGFNKGDMSEVMADLAKESGAKDMSKKEKEEINKKDFGKLTKTQIKDRQVYGAIRAYSELMKMDGEMHPNEVMLLMKFSKDEQKKLSTDYSQDSEEFKFVWAKEENVFTCLKTYNKRQIKTFFDNLFAMAVIDGKIAEAEFSFIYILYTNITGTKEKDTEKKINDMFGIWRAKNNV